MAGFIQGVDRGQAVLFPERLEDWIGEDNLVRVVDLFVEELDLPGLGFVRSAAARTGQPGYEPPRVYRRVICSTTRRPYRVCSGLHRTPPLLRLAGCIR